MKNSKSKSKSSSKSAPLENKSDDLPKKKDSQTKSKISGKEPEEVSLKDVFLDSLKLIKPTIIPALLFIIAFCAIGALCHLTLTNYYWDIQVLTTEYSALQSQIDADPNLVLTDDMEYLQFSYSMVVFISLIYNMVFQFLPQTGILMLMTGKIYNIYTHDNSTPKTWAESIKAPFKTKNKAFTSILIFLLYIIFIPIGILMIYIPGILMMIFLYFSIHALILDDKKGMEALRGGVFYAKDNAARMLGIIFVTIFIPMLIAFLISDPLMTLLNLTTENQIIWLNPATRNYGMLFLYYFCGLLFQSFLYFWFPVVFVVAFTKIRDYKIDQREYQNTLELDTVKSKSNKVKNIELNADQRKYHCLVCGQKLPVAAKKCSNCGQLYRFIIPRKK
jgi:hypothetical protein